MLEVKKIFPLGAKQKRIFTQVERGMREYKTKRDALKFKNYRARKNNYKPILYKSIGKKWIVLY